MKKKDLKKKLNHLDYWVNFSNWCLVHHPEIIEQYQNTLNKGEKLMGKISDLKKINIPLKEQAKSIVVLAFRNGPIENIHAGRSMEIPNDVSRITEDEIKRMMKFAVNYVYGLLWLKERRPNLYKIVIAYGRLSTKKWDAPDISVASLGKIDLEKDKDFLIELAECLTGERVDIK